MALDAHGRRSVIAEERFDLVEVTWRQLRAHTPFTVVSGEPIPVNAATPPAMSMHSAPSSGATRRRAAT
jgi:hypothetical protein